MALKDCRECGKAISTDARACPHCGKRPPGSPIIKYGGGLLLFALALPAIATTLGGQPRAAIASIQAAGPPHDIKTADAPVTKPDDTDKLPVIADGVYVVGTEIAPGTFRVGQYWARQDKNQQTIANDITHGCPSLMVVEPTDAYVSIKGGALDATLSTIDPVKEGCTAGTFLVGKDIAPGRYRITASDDGNAYWARLDRKLDIIANDIGNGPRILIVRNTDFAVKINGGTLQPILGR